MKLKTYVARDPQEALAQVKKDLGPEAVILSTQSRRYASSESRVPGRRGVEVTAAANQALVLDTLQDFQPWDLQAGNSGWSFQDLRGELEEIKGLFKQWLGEQGPPPWLALHPELTRLFQALRRAGVHEQIIGQWLEKLCPSLTNGRNGNPKNLKEWSLRQLMQEVQVLDPWKLPAPVPRKWTFHGATGVGKTTTIAKLAIQAAFMKKLQVGLISLDNLRLGGQDHLAAYARISGLSLVAAQNRRELVEALDKMDDLDLILIDTPGRNPRDPRLPLELNQLFGELPGLEHHLVVSATATEGHLADAFQGFGGMPLTSCLVTKVDEGRDIVPVFNQLYERGMPLSYLTAGQRVPEDLELSSHRRLAGLLLKPHYRQGFRGEGR